MSAHTENGLVWDRWAWRCSNGHAAFGLWTRMRHAVAMMLGIVRRLVHDAH